MTREEALKILKDCRRRGFDRTTYYVDEYHTARDMAIEALEQEPKTGHWIWCGGAHKCSNCEEYSCFSFKKPPRYCPNCGAKMLESEE